MECEPVGRKRMQRQRDPVPLRLRDSA